MSDFNHALNLTHDGTLILRIPKGYEVDKVVVEEMGTDNRKKFVHMPANISDYCEELWKKAYERGKAEGQPQKWIPVSERLPEEGQGCLVYDNGSILIDTFIGHGNPYNWRWYVRDYEAWMPLPEPWKGEEK